jgi:uncharacterized protein (DUF433 family)
MTAMTTVLDREMYTEAGAARLLRVAPATLHYWLEGGTRRNKTYKPVIREEATGSRTVTWAEFVEAGLLRQYRRKHNVPMLELRSFIDRLRDRLEVPYPLAHCRPYVGGRQLIFDAQNEVNLGADFALVAEVSGQYVLTPPSQEFFERVTWEGDIAARWRPDANVDSPVIIDPDIRSGRPSVGGISTEILWEQADAGEDERDLADTYGLTLTQVRWALAYELPLQAA